MNAGFSRCANASKSGDAGNACRPTARPLRRVFYCVAWGYANSTGERAHEMAAANLRKPHVAERFNLSKPDLPTLAKLSAPAWYATRYAWNDRANTPWLPSWLPWLPQLESPALQWLLNGMRHGPSRCACAFAAAEALMPHMQTRHGSLMAVASNQCPAVGAFLLLVLGLNSRNCLTSALTYPPKKKGSLLFS